MVVGPGPALRWAMEELKRRHGYRLIFANDPYEAGLLLENHAVDAVVCEAAPAYTAECRLIREINQRLVSLPVFLFVEPESEQYLFDELAQGTFQVVRPTMSLDAVHQLLSEAITKRRRTQAA
jgi:DNA-binding NtrC family response regulator